jgi:hypothetical protein
LFKEALASRGSVGRDVHVGLDSGATPPPLRAQVPFSGREAVRRRCGYSADQGGGRNVLSADQSGARAGSCR